ncbi:uncharacterized protein STEHIDRAFT_48397 [Stereum hirsutum FP-91666 SS1]|uniref:uncharacterized protein n=1 Tax=Stereum hirsutum (strain FP-91666) TaxID=721885 RepID=UPI000440ED56|nr:uncharacterized protein STEHIDRAFT_48397 [Stereum hirsutum FP-91666 SS1]EIM91286.1 hypothetical protein STEHIDRAFT_48397 [Stereum hirsutum FP-91666 SS1]
MFSRPAWSNAARPSPTFSPGPNSSRLPNGPPAAPSAFPPLNGTPRPEAQHDKTLQALSGLTGTTITLSTKTSIRYEGVVLSTNGEGDTTGVTLKDVKDISNPGAPLKDQIFIASTNIEGWQSGPADAKAPVGNGDSFKTDTDISTKAPPRRERELKAWADDIPGPGTPPYGSDELTFGELSFASGPGSASHNAASNNLNGSTGQNWDQFAANEKLFGVRTQFDEDAYTTKIDRNAADYKERERRAQVLANEIQTSSSNNPHIAEERQMNNVDDSGINEEDKYGAVVRGTNAYIPPGARRGGLSTGPGPSPSPKPPINGNGNGKVEVPKVSINAPDGTAVQPPPSASEGNSKGASPGPAGNKVRSLLSLLIYLAQPADALPAFRDFVTNEKVRLTQKRQTIMKNERDKRMADLLKFSQSFKLNKPIPDDLVTILAKDEEKQRAIRQKSAEDAASAQARTIGVSIVTTGPIASASANKLAAAAGGAAPQHQAASAAKKAPGAGGATPAKSAVDAAKAAAKPARFSMVIQPIPPFKGSGKKPTGGAGAPASATGQGPTTSKSGPAIAMPSSASPAQTQNQMQSPTTANRLNVNASSFRPNPKAASPSTASPSAAQSPKPAHEAPSTPNPFFGTKPLKKTPVHVKDDFNPFKYAKVADATAVAALWPYQGKRYMQLFPPISAPPQQQQQQQQQPPHQPPQPQQSPHMGMAMAPMIPPGPPPPQLPPPPPYEEENPAQAAAARGGYVYAYPPYAHYGQMMPGMAPPPPGAFIPGPYMQHMPYPPTMPPPNGQFPGA